VAPADRAIGGEARPAPLASVIEDILYKLRLHKGPAGTPERSELGMESNAEVVLAVFCAIEERDREALFELYHDEVELYDAPSLPYGYEGVSGKQAMREQLEKAPETSWIGTWGPLQPTARERRMDPRIIATDGDEVVVHCVTRAIAPDGERFESPVVAIYEVRDGKFARARCSITTRRRSWLS
jgi:ketosteroid isomerase-like protein